MLLLVINFFLRTKSLLGRETLRLRNRILRDRRFLCSAEKAKGNETSSLINSIYRLYKNWENYLEIGVEYGFTFEAVQIPKKTGVDPDPKFNTWLKPRNTKIHSITSDHFFNLKCSRLFDLVYLDGLHTFEQTWKDLRNSSRVMSDRGLLIIDDTVPCDEFSALVNQKESYRQRKLAGKPDNGSWHGDVFKILWVLTEYYSEHLDWYTLMDLQNPKTLVIKKSRETYKTIFEKPVNLDIARSKSFMETFDGGQEYVIRPISTQSLFECLAV